MDIFIDEAGELGFSEKSSRYFIFSYFMPRRPKNIRRAMKHFHKQVNRYARHKFNKLHFRKANHQCRIDCYRRVITQNWVVGLIVLKKDTVKAHLKERTDILYNYCILHFMFRNILARYDPKDELNIIIEKGMDRKRRTGFDEYGKLKAEHIWKKEYKNKDSIEDNINIYHKYSKNDYCLQFADFLASGTYQLYENKNYVYFKEFKHKLFNINHLFR